VLTRVSDAAAAATAAADDDDANEADLLDLLCDAATIDRSSGEESECRRRNENLCLTS